MFEAVENFAKQYENTIQAVGSLSTLAAVIASLALARASANRTKPRIKASISTSKIHHSSITQSPTYIVAHIVNIGTVPVRIPFSFFLWKMPHWRNRGMLVNPLDAYQVDKLVPQREYPVELPVYSSESFFVSEFEAFKVETARSLETLSALDRFLFRFASVFIRTDDGTLISARLGKRLRKEVIALSKAANV
jgi:hypothetical protein